MQFFNSIYEFSGRALLNYVTAGAPFRGSRVSFGDSIFSRTLILARQLEIDLAS